MSSVGEYVWNIMSVAKVNSLTIEQLQGLSSTQVSQLMNSPNYDSFSTAIKIYTASVASGTTASTTVSSESCVLKFGLFNFILSLISAIFINALL